VKIRLGREAPLVQSKPVWRLREDALIIVAPLVVVPALAVVPIIVSLLVDPGFRHARLVGLLLLPVFFLSELTGLTRLALVVRREFDVLTFFAAGIVVVFWVVAVCSGILLAIVISQS
jgi:hypothetical protein